MSDAVPITEDWLRSVGFKWHQFNRQPSKQWLLWLGDAARTRVSFGDTQDIGIELADGRDGWWFCWLRSDTAHRYSRFLHVRHIRHRYEVIMLVEALTGQPWDVENHRYGSCLKPGHAARARKDDERLDRRLLRNGHPWREIEDDESRGGALPEHMQAAIDRGKAK